MKKSLIYIFILGTILVANGQADFRKDQYDEMIWIGYYSQVSLNEKWGINSDIQLRTNASLRNNFSHLPDFSNRLPCQFGTAVSFSTVVVHWRTRVSSLGYHVCNIVQMISQKKMPWSRVAALIRRKGLRRSTLEVNQQTDDPRRALRQNAFPQKQVAAGRDRPADVHQDLQRRHRSSRAGSPS